MQYFPMGGFGTRRNLGEPKDPMGGFGTRGNLAEPKNPMGEGTLGNPRAPIMHLSEFLRILGFENIESTKPFENRFRNI